MARSYSGVLATVALCLSVTRGLVLGMTPNEIITQSLGFFFIFALVGFVIGYTADKVVADSVESQFRGEMAAIQARSATDSPSSTSH